jgi:hypothetical protein
MEREPYDLASLVQEWWKRMQSMLRLLFFVVLFTVLCAKGGELCAAGQAHLPNWLFGGDPPRELRQPEPLRPREEAFRGISPLPGVTGRVFSALRPGR